MRRLDLADREPADSAEVAALVEEIRSLAATGPIHIHNCPQMVAHTLYKVGDLRDGRIVLVDPRQEEPYG